jgi:type II secretory pathway component GspD/PulD (secretin)
MIRRSLIAVFVLTSACQEFDEVPEPTYKKMVAQARPPILRQPQQEEDEDLLGWQKLLAERKRQDEERLAKQPKVTAAFVDLGIRDALFEISNQAKIPVVVDGTVSGNVTMDLKAIPFETALRMIVFAGNYAYSTDGTAYYVGTLDEKTANYSVLTSQRVIPTYMPPKQIVASLNKAFANYFSFSEGTHKLVLTGPTSILDRLEEEIRLLDRPPVQVQIEVLVVETKFGSDFDVGLDYGKIEATLERQNTQDFGKTTVNQLDMIGKLAATFNFLQEHRKAVIRSHPKVVTTSGTAAEIRSLVESYVLIVRPGVAAFTSNLEIIKAGTHLKVTPVVTRNNEIELTLEPEVSDVVGISPEASGSLPVVSRRAVKSTIRLKNGDVVIIGGLYQDNLQSISRGLPFLKEIPIVNIFSGKQDGKGSASELLIFVSPKVVK